jgi:hypothetical protein
VFGNPGNDAVTGLERGTFFLYDPTVIAGGKLDWWRENLSLLVVLALVTVVLLIASCCVACCKCWRKGKEEKEGDESAWGEVALESPKAGLVDSFENNDKL